MFIHHTNGFIQYIPDNDDFDDWSFEDLNDLEKAITVLIIIAGFVTTISLFAYFFF